MVVSELFTGNGNGWDRAKVQELFPADICNRILSIPLPRHRGPDRRIWSHTKNGIFSVRTGYMVACQMRDHRMAVSASSIEDLLIWKWINKLQIVPKIRQFMWRCAQGILPVAVELRRRSIPCNVVCRRCGEAEETLEHVLRDCRWSIFYWKASPLRLQINYDDRAPSMREWFEEIAKIDDHYFHALFAVLLWENWKKRNLLVFQNRETQHQVCFDLSLKLCAEFSSKDESKRRPLQPLVMEAWKNPPPGYWKVNVDAAILHNLRVGVGIVIRNDKGEIIVVRCLLLPFSYPPEVAEGYACYEGLVLAHEFGGRKLILETDCQVLYNCLVSRHEDLSYKGEVCRTIETEAAHFDEVIYSWARRTANKVAHSLAQLAISSSRYHSYTGDIPESILLDIPLSERSIMH